MDKMLNIYWDFCNSIILYFEEVVFYLNRDFFFNIWLIFILYYNCNEDCEFLIFECK